MPPPGIKPQHGQKLGTLTHGGRVTGNGENSTIILFGKPISFFSPPDPHEAVFIVGGGAAIVPGPGHLATYFRPHGCRAMVGPPA